MRDFFRKIASMLMTLIVMVSTMSFTVGKHYCGDMLVDLAFFKEAKSCGMELQQNDVPAGCSIMKKDCCSDQITSVEGQDELKITKDVLSLDQQLFVVSFIYTYSDLFEGLEKKVATVDDYPPPLLFKDLPVLYESFLI